MHEIIINGDTYGDNLFVSGNIMLAESFTGEELQYDIFDGEIKSADLMPTKFIPKSSLGLMTVDNKQLGVRPYIILEIKDTSKFKYGAPVIYKYNGTLVGKFYMSEKQHSGIEKWKVKCVSAVGLLAELTHYGGLYFGTPFEEVLAEIIGGTVTYTLDPALKSIKIYGWLPIAKRRDNLRKLIFASSAVIEKDTAGDLFITTPSNDITKEIPKSRAYIGGSVKDLDTAVRVILSEHAYIMRSDDEEMTLYAGSISAMQIEAPSGQIVTGEIIKFDEPAHSLEITGGTIIESGVNYAVLSSSVDCVLRGKKYTHTIRQIIRPEITEGDTSVKKEKTFPNETLVSMLNSESIADRLIEYYKAAQEVKMDIVVGEEHPGDCVTFTNPFNEESTGLIQQMNIKLSGVLKSNTTIVAGYTPPNPGNNYEHVSVLTEDGVYIVPPGVELIRTVLIAGGDGGSGGNRGEDGGEANSSNFGEGGEGGLGGTGGEGGKIYIATLRVTPGQQFNVGIGIGGAGGNINGGVGEQGTDTTFGELSSALGTRSSAGYIEIFSGTSYGARGQSGASGAKGGGKGDRKGGDVIFGNETFEGGTYESGYYEEDKWIQHSGPVSTWKRRFWEYYAGGGGGAAVSYELVDGEYEKYHDPSMDTHIGKSNKDCAGGNGADANDPVTEYDTLPGCGGAGGHGGGGGGGAGVVEVYMVTGDPVHDPSSSSRTEEGVTSGTPGVGGDGSKGQKGADGCVIVYY